MKDAYGGIMNLVFIVLFLLIVIGVLGLIVSYTKAFKMKNVVLSTVEEYEGNCCGVPTPGITCNSKPACVKKISNEASTLGFSPVSINCPNDYTKIQSTNNHNDLYCIKKVDNSSTGRYYYNVIVQVDVHFPVISNILGFRMFQVSGDSRQIVR